MVFFIPFPSQNLGMDFLFPSCSRIFPFISVSQFVWILIPCIIFWDPLIWFRTSESWRPFHAFLLHKRRSILASDKLRAKSNWNKVYRSSSSQPYSVKHEKWALSGLFGHGLAKAKKAVFGGCHPESAPKLAACRTWENSSFGSKIGFGQLAKQQSTAPGLKISSHLRLMFGSCVHNSSIPLQFTHNPPTHTHTLCVCDLPCKWEAACLCLALCLVFCVITSEKKWYVWACVSV